MRPTRRSGATPAAGWRALLVVVVLGIAGCSGGGHASSVPLTEGVHYVLVLSKVDGRSYDRAGIRAGGVQFDLDDPAPGPPQTGLQRVLPFRAALLWSSCGRTRWGSWSLAGSQMTFGDRTDSTGTDPCEPAWGDAYEKARDVLTASPAMRFDGTTMTFTANRHSVAFTVTDTSGPGATTTR